MYCPKHKSSYTNRKDSTDFRVPRTVHLELDSKKKQKFSDLRSVRVYIGSLQIEQLGYLHPKASDSKDFLLPVGFICSRYYWSTRDPTRIVRYNCRTKLIAPNVAEEEEQLNEASHLVIDHSKANKKLVETQLTEFRRKCRQIELRRAKKLMKQSNILPPVLVSSLWKHLRYRDLHPEMFDKSDVKKVRRVNFKTPTNCDESTESPWKKLLSERLSSTKSADSLISPTKRLNKAVGNIFQRTPTKHLLDNDSSEFEDDLAHLIEIDNVDKELISSILEDEKFVESSLDSSMKEIVEKDSECFIVKTWFNQVTFNTELV